MRRDSVVLRVIVWGLWAEGSSTVRVAVDGPSAFREERWRRLNRESVVVVVRVGSEWETVPEWSPLRPSPRPPAGPSVRPQSGCLVARVCRSVGEWLGFDSRADSVRVGPEFRRRLWPR